ncbi:MAG: response regulator [Planctomycetes bacterium]|nr:response regulator [Planctomycetota bacterium]
MARALRVLLIGNNRDDPFLIERALRPEFDDVQVEQVIDADSLEDALARGEFDLVISDSQFGWGDGVAVIATIKVQFPDRPVIMFIDSDDEEIAAKAIEGDIDDYVVKSNDPVRRLGMVCRSVLERLREIRRANELVRQMRSLLKRLNVGLFRCTVGGVVLEINAAARAILGLSAEIGPGDTLPDRLMKHETFAQLFDQLRRSPASEETVLHWPRSESGPQWIRVSAASYLNEDAEFVIEGILENVVLSEWEETRCHLRSKAITRVSQLSARERQVMQLVVSGQTSKLIALELKIKIKTVEMHRANIMRKLQIDNLAHLIRLAMTANPDC